MTIEEGGPVQGLSARDYFAAHAPLPPVWWHVGRDVSDSAFQFVRWRWYYADKMLEQRGQVP